MKTIKRSIALVLAMILTLAMSVTVFAAPNADQNTFSLTLNKAVKGHTYEAYQILSGDLSADKATLSNIKWGEGITEAGQTALGGDAASYAEKLGGFGNNSSELKEQAQIIGANLASASGSVTVTLYIFFNFQSDSVFFGSAADFLHAKPPEAAQAHQIPFL